MRFSEIELVEYSEFDLHHEFFEDISQLDAALFENYEDYNKLTQILNGFDTPEPEVNNRYCFASVAATPIAKIINIAKFSTEHRLTDIRRDKYIFEVAGCQRAFPEQGSIKQGDSYQHIFMFDSVESCDKLVNWLGLNYSGDSGWRLSTKQLTENFADGKKPGRKGLAKRVGVNCRQSVSKLRKIAKNSSGERQRMAHWCANMKSGRSK
jgi:hypothetical protein